MVLYTCNKCKKQFKKKCNYDYHTKLKKNPCTIIVAEELPKVILDKPKYICKYCLYIFKRSDYLKIHVDKRCKMKHKINEVDNINIYKKLDIIKDDIKKINNINPINEQLFNIIVRKDKKIEELQTNKINIIDANKEDNNEIIKPLSLILNNVIIQSRNEDHYINATQLCQAGGKNFNDWISLDNTNELIKILENESGISSSQLLDIKKNKSNNYNQGSWIHPDLACQLAQWISPIFALQVIKWSRSIFTNSNKDIELKTKDKKIKVLENLCVKKHKREEYPGKYVIYMLTTEEHKKNQTYIIGKATDLKDRLGTYNKTCNHEVVYYKECKSKEDMKVIEDMVILKLNKYKEVANRDRFVLPIENDIKLFTDIIDTCVIFFN